MSEKKRKLTPELRKKIAKYCSELLVFIDRSYLVDRGILENEFLRYFFNACEKEYLETGKYTFSANEITQLIEMKKQNDIFLDIVEKQNGILTTVDEEDNLLFEFKDTELIFIKELPPPNEQ